MGEGFISRGFRGRRRQESDVAGRIPPGQYLTTDFPVLSAGPTPGTPLTRWDFSLMGVLGQPKRWTWDEFRALPSETVTKDIHCVTKWSKLDTTWEGVSVDTLLEGVETSADHVVAFCDGGYTTNLPLDVFLDDDVLLCYRRDGEDITPDHGWPLRLVVPKRYFWKSAKWVRGLEFMAHDRLGFWEQLGYNNNADPWQEERFA